MIVWSKRPLGKKDDTHKLHVKCDSSSLESSRAGLISEQSDASREHVAAATMGTCIVEENSRLHLQFSAHKGAQCSPPHHATAQQLCVPKNKGGKATGAFAAGTPPAEHITKSVFATASASLRCFECHLGPVESADAALGGESRATSRSEPAHLLAECRRRRGRDGERQQARSANKMFGHCVVSHATRSNM
ncbi:hypothetical protein TRVL_04670 [Trypanosoma vivax]|nr:hypothetical protein TRVL_04670 [Trypanosoma vivax]